MVRMRAMQEREGETGREEDREMVANQEQEQEQEQE